MSNSRQSPRPSSPSPPPLPSFDGGPELIAPSQTRSKSGTPDRDSSNGFQALASYRHGHRRLRPAAKPWTRASAERDDPGCGDTAALSAREHALAQPECHPGSGQWRNPAPLPEALGREGSAGESPCFAGRHAARPSRPDPRHLLGAGQAPWRSHRPQSDRPWQEGHQYHIATDGDGVPVACLATAANVNDTLAFERLFLAAFAVMARVRTVFADKGYDAEHHRDLCRAFGAEPGIHKRGQPRGSGLGQHRWPVERRNAWVLENRRLGLRYDRLGFIIHSLLQAACIFLVAGRLASQF